MKSVGLDLSLKATGVCVLDSSGSPGCVTSLIVGEVGKTVQEKVGNLMYIADKICEVVKRVRPDVVVIEAPAMNQKWQAAAIGELHGVVKVELVSECGIFPVVAQATKMRSEVVGKIERIYLKSTSSDGEVTKKVSYGEIQGKKGRMKKATIKDIIESRLAQRGLVFNTQDEMDAYVAAAWGMMLKDGKDARV